MKLYLSSYSFGNHTDRLTSLVGPNKRVGIIMNAGDAYDNEKRRTYLAREVTKFKEFDLHANELDLREYFTKNDSRALQDALSSYGLLWVMGGNSFLLRRAMKVSGFDTAVKDLVTSEALVYAGFSAGSVVATQTLHGIELVDDPAQLADGYDKTIVWDGLGFVDFSIAPHYRSEHPESASIEKVVEYFEKEGMPYKAISDGQVIVVDGNKTTLES
jgi:dipeptidase E